MRKLSSTMLVVIMLTASLLLTSQTVTTAQTQLRTAQSQRATTADIKNVETKRGVEVAARVEGLRRDSLNVRSALRLFERRGHRPKIEEASSISGAIERAEKGARNERGFSIRKANFAQTIREGSIEMVWVPVLDTPTEWQGTMITRLYNENNQVMSEEVFNLVMVQEDPDVAHWRPIYELSIVSGTPFLHDEPGLFTGFALAGC